MKLPSGPFGCILADPPWAFKAFDGRNLTPTQKRTNGLASAHYETTETSSLAEIPVATVAAKNCVLFMWVVDSHMPEALELGKAWGFQYKTCAFVWVKEKYGKVPRPTLGYWTRKQTEQCWLFTRGKPSRISKGVEQAIFCGRGQHSAKPDEQYERIEALVGGPYLELFSRLNRPGWTAWGNQTGVRDGLFDRVCA